MVEIKDRKLYTASPGAWEMIVEKRSLLAAYDKARWQAESRPVKVEHGNVGEAEFRGWLSRFLPRRYGVCRGFIIDSWTGAFEESELLHSDCIVYDALEAPVLFADDNSDVVPERRNFAIPARHVMAVLEVKSRLRRDSAAKAVAQLTALRRLSDKLHPHFGCGYVFFEIDPSEEKSPETLGALIPNAPLPGLFGGVILRGTEIDPDLTARVDLQASPRPMPSNLKGDLTISAPGDQWRCSKSVEWESGIKGALTTVVIDGSGTHTLEGNETAHYYVFVHWSLNNFAHFGFRLLAHLQGRGSDPKVDPDNPLILGKTANFRAKPED